MVFTSPHRKGGDFLNPYHITRAHIDTIVERKIDEVSKDPKAALQSLLAYSHRFSSSGFQAPIFSILNHLLANEDSQYHIMIQKLLEQNSHSTIKNLCINLGYNSWTYGAQMIRNTSPKIGYCIPWNITFHWNPSDPDGLNLESIHRFIREGNRMGIFSFCIRQETAHPVSGEIFSLFASHPDSTFFWFLPDQLLSPIYIDMLKTHENTVAIFNDKSSYCLQNTTSLKERKIIYGIYHVYTSNTSYPMIRECINCCSVYNSAFVIMIADDLCGTEFQTQMADYVYNIRTTEKLPFFLLDYYSDIMRINYLISEENSFLEINSDYSLAYPKDFANPIRSDAPLEWYLASSMPPSIHNMMHTHKYSSANTV